jgi:hypothetical protein
MNITKKEFFKHKNRKQVYAVYENTVNCAYDLSERYANKLSILRKRKDEYRANSHIWKILSDVESSNASFFESCAFLRCNNLKRSAFVVSLEEYDNIVLDTQKLAKAIGNIESTLDFVNYLEHNNLVVRVK